MKKKLLINFSILVCFLTNFSLNISAQVNMVVIEPAGNFSIDDLWNITITIPSNANYKSLFLTLDVYEQNKGQILHSKSSNIQTTFGTISINKSNLFLIEPIKSTFYVNGNLRSKIENGEPFPNGNYSFFIRLYSFQLIPETNQKNVLLSEYNYSKETEIIQPPFLIYIYNDDCINEKNPTFLWTGPFPILGNQKIEYQFKLVEIHSNQSMETAMFTNRPLYSEEHISNTFFTYPLYAPEFIDGKKYAWQIIVYSDNQYLCSSEIWNFIYRTNCADINKEYTKIDTVNLSYLELKTELDGRFYTASNNIIKFIYNEAYYKDSNSFLKFKVTNEENKIIASDENSLDLPVKQGANKYEVFICDFKNNLPKGFYILEITNDKNQKQYLKFYKPDNNCN